MSTYAGQFPRPVAVPRQRASPDTARFGVGLGLAMLFVIAGTVLAGKAIAFASIPFFVIAVVVYALADPTKSLSVFIAYAAMEGMFKYLSGYSQIVYVIKPILAFAILIGMLLSARNFNRTMSAPPLTVLLAALSAWCLVATLNPFGSGIAGGLASAFVWYLAPMVALFTGYNALKSSRQVEAVIYACVSITVVVSLFTIVQYAMGQAWTEAHLPGYAKMNEGIWWVQNAQGVTTGTSFRPASTTAIGGGGGQWSDFGILLTLGLLLSPKVTPRRKVLLGACLLVLMTGMICCAVRLFLLSGIICVITLFVITAKSPRELGRNLGLLLFVGLIAWGGMTLAQAASGGVVASRYQSTLDNPLAKYDHDRGGVGQRSIWIVTQLAQYPLGVGYQHGADGYGGTGAYNSSGGLDAPGANENRDDEFSAISYDLGWPGLILLLMLFVSVLSKGWHALHRLRDAHLRAMAASLFVLLACVIIFCFAGPAMQADDNFWLFLAALCVLPAIERRERLLNPGSKGATP